MTPLSTDRCCWWWSALVQCSVHTRGGGVEVSRQRQGEGKKRESYSAAAKHQQQCQRLEQAGGSWWSQTMQPTKNVFSPWSFDIAFLFQWYCMNCTYVWCSLRGRIVKFWVSAEHTSYLGARGGGIAWRWALKYFKPHNNPHTDEQEWLRDSGLSKLCGYKNRMKPLNASDPRINPRPASVHASNIKTELSP